MREIGRGYSALEKLCGYLNLSPPMQVNAFNEIQKTILEVCNTVTLQSMTDAVDEQQQNKDEQGISDVTVSIISVMEIQNPIQMLLYMTHTMGKSKKVRMPWTHAETFRRKVEKIKNYK